MRWNMQPGIGLVGSGQRTLPVLEDEQLLPGKFCTPLELNSPTVATVLSVEIDDL